MLMIIILGFFFQLLPAQNNDAVLFTVADDPVYLSEFKYIYEKNNADKADYSKESLEEYLELYQKFKLKVKRARSLGLDTVKVLQKELEGYRKQLAKSYLKDKEISERLIDEVAKRMEEDIEVFHIFISAPAKSPKEKTDAAEKKIGDIYDKLRTLGASAFGDMAKTMSEDKASGMRGGRLGYYTAPLPDGFYEFENAMYATQPGEISAPVRSKMGFHILMVKDRRPAKGQMEIAHILIRNEKNKKTKEEALTLADTVYNLLKEGRNFENLAAKYSEDSKSKHKGGYLGFFGVNQYELNFENAAFALKNDNDITKPTETSLGYHIIKRISKRDNSDKARLRKRIQARINNDDRFKIAEEKMIEDVKMDAGFSEDKMAFKRLSTSINEEFYSYKWTAPEYDESLKLFTLADESYSLLDFAKYAKTNVRERLKFSKKKPVEEAVEEMYDQYVKDEVMAYEEANLESKYPDFKALMREYREGILLFEITKQEVWDKASQDSIGLANFFKTTDKKYMWPERVKVKKYMIEGGSDVEVLSAYKFAQKKEHQKFLEKYKNDSNLKITFTETVMDRDAKELSNLDMRKNGLSQLALSPSPASFYRYVDRIAPSPKTLAEAKGYVIADYQDYLENEWINELKKMYPVKVNEKTLKSIIK